MMREFKFRAWDKKYKRMSQPFGIGGNISCLVYFPEEDGKLDSVLIEMVACEKERFVIMQFSGLKDVYGREIYENDIIKIKTALGRIKQAIVSFRLGYFLSFFNALDYDPLYDIVHDCKVEIIGNIYQNPELLGGK